ncbi:hypothetical protein CBS101457_003036 [Exobasidium rhododendri]|nr:hypothetical protein CBS101457_003036 [Exobasidium rhododendri]
MTPTTLLLLVVACLCGLSAANPLPMDGRWSLNPFRSGKVKTRSTDASGHRAGLSEAHTARLPTNRDMSYYAGLHPSSLLVSGDSSSSHHDAGGQYQGGHTYDPSYGYNTYNDAPSLPYGQDGGQFGEPLPHQFMSYDDSHIQSYGLRDTNYHPNLFDQHQGGGGGGSSSSDAYGAQADYSYSYNPDQFSGMSLYDNNSHYHGGEYGTSSSSHHLYNDSNNNVIEVPDDDDTPYHSTPALPVPQSNPAEEQYDDTRLIWNSMREGAHRMVDEIVSKRRGLRYDSARKFIRPVLTQRKLMLLCSGDIAKIDAFLRTIIRESKKSTFPLWMNKLTPDECDTLVERLKQVSGQSLELIRNNFLSSRLDSDTAYTLYHSDDDFLTVWAEGRGFMLDKNKVDKDGYKRNHTTALPKYNYLVGLSKEEGIELVNMLREKYKLKPSFISMHLRDNRIPVGFGKKLLYSSGEYQKSLVFFLEHGVWLDVTDGSDQ